MAGRLAGAFLCLLLFGFQSFASCPQAQAAGADSAIMVSGNRHTDADDNPLVLSSCRRRDF